MSEAEQIRNLIRKQFSERTSEWVIDYVDQNGIHYRKRDNLPARKTAARDGLTQTDSSLQINTREARPVG